MEYKAMPRYQKRRRNRNHHPQPDLLDCARDRDLRAAPFWVTNLDHRSPTTLPTPETGEAHRDRHHRARLALREARIFHFPIECGHQQSLNFFVAYRRRPDVRH
jgi:hypothetical protein